MAPAEPQEGTLLHQDYEGKAWIYIGGEWRQLYVHNKDGELVPLTVWMRKPGTD